MAKDKVNEQKKQKKHASDSEAIIRDAYQNIFKLKHEVSFKKEERDRERLAGDEAMSQDREMRKKTLLLDRKFQSNQLTKLNQLQSSAQSTDSHIISELLEQVERLQIDLEES